MPLTHSNFTLFVAKHNRDLKLLLKRLAGVCASLVFIGKRFGRHDQKQWMGNYPESRAAPGD